MEMESSTAPANTSISVISDLNDDCFLEVFKQLNLADLCAVADVCRRFRQISQRHFASPKLKYDFLDINCLVDRICCDSPNFGTISFPKSGNTKDESRSIRFNESTTTSQKLLHISRLLRNFGDLMKSIRVRGEANTCILAAAETQYKYDSNILDLISSYCSDGELSSLIIECCDITDEAGSTRRVPLLNLKKLKLCDCVISRSFARTLPSWAPQLRELYILNLSKLSIQVPCEDIMHLSFSALVLIAFRNIFNLKFNGIDDFLKLNPQLRKIGLVNCPHIDDSIFQSIALHVPQIEAIQIDRDSAINDGSLFSIGQFNNLSTLKLLASCGKKDNINRFMPLILNKMHAAEIALKHLHVGGIRAFQGAERLVDAISKFKTLQTLWIFCVPELEKAHIMDMCKSLEELSELNLQYSEVMLDSDDLVELINHTQKLQVLEYFEREDIFADFKCRERYESLLNSDEKINRSPSDKNGRQSSLTREVLDGILVYRPEMPRLADVAKNFDGIIDYAESLLELNRTSWMIKRLRSLENAPRCADEYMKIVEVVGQRRERIRLLIKLNDWHPMVAHIPADLMRRYKDTLAIEGVEWKQCDPMLFEQINI